MRIRLDKLDSLFSRYIRMRAIAQVGGCQRCLTPKVDYKQLQAAHFHGRSRRSVRWDEDNSCGLCMGCHVYLDSHPLEQVEFFKTLLGERDFDLLNARTRVTAKPDKNALTLYLRQKIRDLNSENKGDVDVH